MGMISPTDKKHDALSRRRSLDAVGLHAPDNGAHKVNVEDRIDIEQVENNGDPQKLRAF